MTYSPEHLSEAMDHLKDKVEDMVEEEHKENGMGDIAGLLAHWAPTTSNLG